VSLAGHVQHAYGATLGGVEPSSPIGCAGNIDDSFVIDLAQDSVQTENILGPIVLQKGFVSGVQVVVVEANKGP